MPSLSGVYEKFHPLILLISSGLKDPAALYHLNPAALKIVYVQSAEDLIGLDVVLLGPDQEDHPLYQAALTRMHSRGFGTPPAEKE